MKWVSFFGEIIGLLSTFFLMFGFSPPSGEPFLYQGVEYPAGTLILTPAAKWGFMMLAASFAIQAFVTLAS
jgi:hypothetical protein